MPAQAYLLAANVVSQAIGSVNSTLQQLNDPERFRVSSIAGSGVNMKLEIYSASAAP